MTPPVADTKRYRLKHEATGEVNGHVSIIVLDAYHDTVLFLTLLHKQLVEGKLNRLPKLVVRGKKFLDKKGILIAMLQAVPGVGQERARRIADKYSSISELMRAPQYWD